MTEQRENQFEHINGLDFNTIGWAMIRSEVELREQGKTADLFLTDAELRETINLFERDAVEAIRVVMKFARHRLREAAKKHDLRPSCTHCGDQFTPKRSDAKYCSTKCRVAAHRAGAKT